MVGATITTTNASTPSVAVAHDSMESRLPEISAPLQDGMLKLCQLLSDGTRLKILLLLAREPELHVKALCQRLLQSQPAVSHHLALLKEAGVIEMRREGKHNFYRILPERFQELLGLVFETLLTTTLDEPTTSLDPPGRAAFLALLRSLPQTRLIATHDIYAINTAERLTPIMTNGRSKPITTSLVAELMMVWVMTWVLPLCDRGRRAARRDPSLRWRRVRAGARCCQGLLPSPTALRNQYID